MFFLSGLNTFDTHPAQVLYYVIIWKQLEIKHRNRTGNLKNIAIAFGKGSCKVTHISSYLLPIFHSLMIKTVAVVQQKTIKLLISTQKPFH